MCIYILLCGKKQLLFAVEMLFYQTDRQGYYCLYACKKKKKNKQYELSISFPAEEASDIKIKNMEIFFFFFFTFFHSSYFKIF